MFPRQEPQVVRRYEGGLAEAEQILCGLGDLNDPRDMGHTFQCSKGLGDVDECTKCGFEDKCEHDAQQDNEEDVR